MESRRGCMKSAAKELVTSACTFLWLLLQTSLLMAVLCLEAGVVLMLFQCCTSINLVASIKQCIHLIIWSVLPFRFSVYASFLAGIVILCVRTVLLSMIRFSISLSSYRVFIGCCLTSADILVGYPCYLAYSFSYCDNCVVMYFVVQVSSDFADNL